jgi:hypothetical protein
MNPGWAASTANSWPRNWGRKRIHAAMTPPPRIDTVSKRARTHTGNQRFAWKGDIVAYLTPEIVFLSEFELVTFFHKLYTVGVDGKSECRRRLSRGIAAGHMMIF